VVALVWVLVFVLLAGIVVCTVRSVNKLKKLKVEVKEPPPSQKGPA
jgi:hypothetical protein